MKKIKHLCLYIGVGILSLSSCSDQIEQDIENNANSETNVGIRSVNSFVNIVDGRISFNNEMEVEQFYKRLANDEDLYDRFNNQILDDGFVSLGTPVNEEREEEYITLLRNVVSKEINQVIDRNPEVLADYFDHAESVIVDDVFRSLLNLKGEIQVGEKIYKYTDTGLYKVDVKNYQELNRTVKDKNISDFLLVPSNESVVINNVGALHSIGFANGINNATPSKFRWIHDGALEVFLPYNPALSSNQATAYQATTGQALQTDPNYENWIQTIGNCSPRNTVYEKIINGLFGDHLICLDKYKKRRRVKTKAWNMDYGLFYATGISVKHQKKAVLWFADEVSEVKIIAEAIQYEYNVQTPYAVTVPSNYSQIKDMKVFYSNLGFRMDYNPNSIFQYSIESFNMSGYPEVFKSDITFEWFETGWAALDNGAATGLNANMLNEFFWQGAWTTASSLLSSFSTQFNLNTGNRTGIIKYPLHDKVYIQKSYMKSKYNTNKISKTIDLGGAIGITMTNTGGSSNWSTSASTASNILTQPKKFKVKLIGAAKTGSHGWRGSKLTNM